MFGYDSLVDIRDLELFLYDGPETVEQVYDTSDSYSAERMGRRHYKDNCALCEDNTKNNSGIWYSYVINPDTYTVEYELHNDTK